MQFYENYLLQCNKIKKSPAKVAIENGFSRMSANRWKNGVIPSGQNLKKLADYFGITVDELLGDTLYIRKDVVMKAMAVAYAEDMKKSPADDGETLTEEQIENFIGSVTDKDTLLFMMEQIVKRQRELNEK